MMNCTKCGKILTHNEIGLHKKLVNRGSKEFMCMNCLGEYFEISNDDLKKMIEKFKNQGCTLFD
ncbi:MAG: hypothetical protein IJQ50_02835 [Clostridia bacterium]|nr:hypothetical protein [Clostridia bacterium]